MYQNNKMKGAKYGKLGSECKKDGTETKKATNSQSLSCPNALPRQHQKASSHAC